MTETVTQEAERIVYGDREQTYGHPSKNFAATAVMWEAYLQAKYEIGGDYKIPCIEPDDVAMMMVLLKIARQAHQYKRDNIVDGIGYLACIQKMRDYAGE